MIQHSVLIAHREPAKSIVIISKIWPVIQKLAIAALDKKLLGEMYFLGLIPWYIYIDIYTV